MCRYLFEVNSDLPVVQCHSTAQAEMLYRQVQFVVKEADWATKGEELNISEKGKEA